MKNFYYLLFIFLGSLFLVSNSAQPGVWNAGGSGSFTLLYPEDTVAYKKIQMKSEDIFMQLYKGFATVKGTYYFKNTASDTLKIKVGYPVNNVFENVQFHHEVNEVRVEGLYKIKGLINGVEAPIYKKPNAENDNWYVWEITFPPNKITEFTVYFLVNTNNAKIIKGYNSDKKNAFIYLIETGSLWKSPIEKGDFYTQFKDDISIDNVKTSSPTSLFFDEENAILKFSLSDYGKKPDPNFIITYGKKIENFNFKEITSKSDLYFKSIDRFSKNNFNNYNFNLIELENAYKVGGISNNAIGLIFYLVIYGIPILLGVLALFIFIILYRKFIKK
ncbi:hypothetical protein H9W90_10710 [Polaribacter pectinis]|uniref:Uncharacterized protein n=1 Tax=Polaribacter pectinis TaxID=2738844 RepID=A0A7G9L7R8_9FLAO|nr:hypothetical protein [Polaribacter pectinis]QNM84667.1 hypothetical protein H9W90_10710 [Polaribacter pectinis]